MRPRIIIYFAAGVIALGFLSAGCAQALVTSGMLVKGTASTVYYVGKDGKRYVFPNQPTFNSWHPEGKIPTITKITDRELSALPLAGNVTIRPGVALVKIQTDPKVYAISAGGHLHWVEDEDTAESLYGRDWNKKVLDVPDVFFANYLIDATIEAAGSYDRNAAMNHVDTIQKDLDARDNYLPDKWMSASQKKAMNGLTNLFESGETYPSYSMVEALGDGRGYTSGKAGFTTATGDAYLVVKRYTDKLMNNPLKSFLAVLERLSDQESGNIDELDGYPEAWQKAALDPLFRSTQDEITQELYYLPAMSKADGLGIKSALTRAFMYDTIIQHGGGDDPDGLDALVDRTSAKVKGNPSQGIAENVWLGAMLDERQKTLLDASDPETREAWAASAYRVNVYRQLLNEGNTTLTLPIRVKEDWIDTTIR